MAVRDDLGISAGPLVVKTWLGQSQSNLFGLMMAEYVVFHVHCACFVAVVDTLSWRKGLSAATAGLRVGFIVVSQLLIVFIVFCFTWMQNR